MAWLGGRLALPGGTYRAVVGVVLLLSSLRFVVKLRAPDISEGQPTRPVAFLVGATLGLLAGLTGVGGGIFLSPLVLMLGWADLRTTAATSVVFILANSAAGLAAQFTNALEWPPDLALWAIAVAVGGGIGSWLGSRRLPSPALRMVLAVVLAVAGIKLL
jgi:uncharacterized membrane protein YfcA